MSELPRHDYRPETPGPLGGVKIVDLSRLVAGNMVSHVLADLGADVVKIERPGSGDDLRNWRTEGISTHWKFMARNYKSVVMDLRAEGGMDLLLRLIETAQVLVENFRPGTLEKMGLAPQILHERNPKLVIVRVSGWGQDGPYKHKPGFGSLVEAMSGFAASTGYPDRPPVLPPLALADQIAGLYGATATLTALREVEVKGGRGQVVDLSLFESIFSLFGAEAAIYQITGQVKPRVGSRSQTTAPRNVYRCKDGKYVALSASMQTMAERLFRAIGRPDLIEDPRFRTNADRVRNIDEVDEIVADYMARHTQEENLRHFEEAHVTVGPVRDIGELMVDPFISGREILARFPDDEMGEVAMPEVVPRLSGTPGAVRSPAPELGQHTREVLGGLGLAGAELDDLERKGVIHAA